MSSSHFCTNLRFSKHIVTQFHPPQNYLLSKQLYHMSHKIKYEIKIEVIIFFYIIEVIIIKYENQIQIFLLNKSFLFI